METRTPFDLNHAIQQWRADLAQSAAFRGENLDELETHLRDSVAAWQARDLSAEEAFYIAAKRVGSGAVLVKEFGKVNVTNIWVERCLWALIAMQTWTVIQTVFVAIGTFFQLNSRSLVNPSFGWAAISYIMLFSVVPMVVALLIFWRLFRSPGSKVGRFLESLSVRPFTIALLFFFLSEVAHLFYAYLVNYNNHATGTALWMLYLWYLPGTLAFSSLIFILARRRLLRKA